jgi:hypothetical protein
MKIKLKDIKQIVEEVVQDAISEQEPPAEPEAAQPAVNQKADVGVVLKYIEKINNIQEYVQLLEAVLAHTPAGDEGLKKRALLAVFKKLGIASSAVKKVAGE